MNLKIAQTYVHFFHLPSFFLLFSRFDGFDDLAA